MAYQRRAQFAPLDRIDGDGCTKPRSWRHVSGRIPLTRRPLCRLQRPLRYRPRRGDDSVRRPATPTITVVPNSATVTITSLRRPRPSLPCRRRRRRRSRGSDRHDPPCRPARCRPAPRPAPTSAQGNPTCTHAGSTIRHNRPDHAVQVAQPWLTDHRHRAVGPGSSATRVQHVAPAVGAAAIGGLALRSHRPACLGMRRDCSSLAQQRCETIRPRSAYETSASRPRLAYPARPVIVTPLRRSLTRSGASRSASSRVAAELWSARTVITCRYGAVVAERRISGAN